MSRDDEPIDLVQMADLLCRGELDHAAQETLAEKIRDNPSDIQELRQQVWVDNILRADSQVNASPLEAKIARVIKGERHSAVLQLDLVVRRDIRNRRRRRQLRLWAVASAAAVLLAALATGAWIISSNDPTDMAQSMPITWHDELGERLLGLVENSVGSRTIVGSDGSRLLLGGRTRISIHGGQRVGLIAGKITCDIAPRSEDKRLVFDLDTHEVTVIGTRLHLERRGSFRQVAIDEGTVTIQGPEGKLQTMSAGESFSAIEPPIAAIAHKRSAETPAWRLPFAVSSEPAEGFAVSGPQPGVWIEPGIETAWHNGVMTLTHPKEAARATTWFALPPPNTADFRVSFDIQMHSQDTGGSIRIGTNSLSRDIPGYPSSVFKKLSVMEIGGINRYELQFRTIGVIEGVGVIAESCLILEGKPIMRHWLVNPDQIFGISGHRCSYSISNIRYGPLTP